MTSTPQTSLVAQVITLPWPPKGLSPNDRLHHHALAALKKKYREACGWQCIVDGLKPMEGVEKALVHIVFFPPRKVKQVPLMMRPLPFAVLSVLSAMRRARVRVPIGIHDHTYSDVPNALQFPHTANKAAAKEAARILESIGGAVGEDSFWHFEYQPMSAIDEICTSGCIPDQVSHQFYPTPEPLAARVVEMADIKPGMSVLEPSAGQGGLADLMPGCLCVEAAQLNFRVLTAKGHRALHVDFLAWVANWGADEKFDRVVMNPPFDQGRWLAHVEAAAKLVAPGGRLVAILPSGASKRLDLGDGWKCSWLGPLENQFPGVSVDVVILTADRVS